VGNGVGGVDEVVVGRKKIWRREEEKGHRRTHGSTVRMKKYTASKKP